MADRQISKGISVPTLRGQLESVIDRVEDALPAKLKGQAKRFIQVSLLAFATSKNRDKLEQCDPATYMQAFLEACSVGFPLDDKNVYAIPYGKVVTCSFDYKALITVARRCGAIKDAWAQDVCVNDKFWQRDRNGQREYEFEMAEDEDNRGEIKGAYAVAILPDGTVRYEYMTRKQLEKLRASSKSPQSPAWANWAERMYCKGPLKRTLQGLETDTSFGRMIELDNREFDVDRIIEGRSSESQASESRVETYDQLADKLHETAPVQPAIEHKPEAEQFEQRQEEAEPVTVEATRPKPATTTAAAGIPPRPTRPSIGNHPNGVR
jgi:recombination protein RecT